MYQSSLILGWWGGGGVLEGAHPAGMCWELLRHACRSGFLQFPLGHPPQQRSPCVTGGGGGALVPAGPEAEPARRRSPTSAKPREGTDVPVRYSSGVRRLRVCVCGCGHGVIRLRVCVCGCGLSVALRSLCCARGGGHRLHARYLQERTLNAGTFEVSAAFTTAGKERGKVCVCVTRKL